MAFMWSRSRKTHSALRKLEPHILGGSVRLVCCTEIGAPWFVEFVPTDPSLDPVQISSSAEEQEWAVKDVWSVIADHGGTLDMHKLLIGWSAPMGEIVYR